MPSLLEAYLEQVAAHLSALPTKRRNEELREMRQHLLNAVTVNRELGQSEDEAVQNAVMQFGTPEDLGGNLVWAWRRGVMLDKGGFWSAVACASTMVTLPAFIPDFLVGFEPHAAMPSAIFDLGIAIPFAVPVIAAAILGKRHPKQAVAGTAVGTTLYLVCCAGEFLLVGHGHTQHFPNTLRVAAGFAGEGITGLFAAWAGSRWGLMWRLARD